MKAWFPGVLILIALLLQGCSDQTELQRTVQAVGPARLRRDAIATCNGTFPRSEPAKIPESSWLPSLKAFHPLSVWAEPDGVYVLLDSDVSGERGVFVPRVIAEKDPICGPKLKHVKLAEGVYWYERLR